MEIVTSKLIENTLYIYLHGRIDSTNAASVEVMLEKAKEGVNYETIIIDVDDLEYLSSAGLRIILRMLKGCPTLKIINASSEVYEIFEMTGFTEMLPIQKAYRKFSVDGCEVVGQGANGIVYRLDEDTIVKAYFKPDCLPDIQRERDLARRALILGIPTAIPYDVVRVGDSYGSVFELLNAKSFTKILNKEPERIDEIVGMYVDLLKKIHSTEVEPEDMPDMKAVVVDWANFLKDYLEPEKWQKLTDLIAAVPEDHHMIHGDYHTKNVMVQNGEVLLIDMDTLAQGNPVFEFASIFNAYIGFYIANNFSRESFIDLPHEISKQIWEKTLKLYFDTDDAEYLKTVEDKSKLIGYTRLMRRLIRRNGLETEEGRKEIAFYKEQIESLLDTVDTLIF